MQQLLETIKILKIALITLVIGGIFFLFFNYNPTTSSLFFSCPFHYITGFYCPGCGSQRAIHLLIHGDVWGAFRFNPLMVLTLPILIYGLGIMAINFVFETNYRFKLFYSAIFIYGYFGLVFIYWVLRNIPYPPFSFLAPTG